MGENMRRIFVVFMCAFALVACDKHDPILPGARTPIFSGARINVLNKTITNAPTDTVAVNTDDCPYTQDKNNVIWHGDKKIFSGFPTSNTVSANQRPVCSGKYVYAGLTTGEVIKVNPSNRQIAWIADIYRPSNLTGGASMVDIVAPVVPYGKFVFAGGLGDAFCKLSATDGHKYWCLDISVAMPFIITDAYAFVVSTDNYLYAVATKNGDIYWRTPVKTQSAPEYKNAQIIVANETFDIANGKKLK